jgi:hypothetical protein
MANTTTTASGMDHKSRAISDSIHVEIKSSFDLHGWRNATGGYENPGLLLSGMH